MVSVYATQANTTVTTENAVSTIGVTQSNTRVLTDQETNSIVSNEVSTKVTTDSTNFNIKISETVNSIKIAENIVVEGSSSDTTFIDRARLESAFNEAYATAYTEFTTVSNNITSVDIWDTSAKATKLFTKSISYSSDNPTTIVLVDEINNKTLTTSITYSGSDITSITKTFA